MSASLGSGFVLFEGLAVVPLGLIMSPRHQIVEVSLTDAEQFSVRVGEEQRSGELYYLGIDPKAADHDCSAEVGLQNLISGWITELISAEEGRILYLPFDFSDEFTRWLACERTGSEVTCVFGMAEVEGWSFSPSDFGGLAKSLQGFQADVPTNPQTFYLPRMLSDLRQSHGRLQVGT